MTPFDAGPDPVEAVAAFLDPRPRRADALVALLAHAALDEGPVRGPVVPPEAMPLFAAEWRRRPGLRTAIRTVGRRADLRAARGRNRLIAALCEMGESAEWRGRDPLDELADLAAETT